MAVEDAVKHWIPVLALIAGWLAATAVVVVLVVDARHTALERGQRSTAALAQVMEQHSARTFQSASLTVGAVADAWTLLQPRKHDAGFQALLSQRLKNLPYVRALLVIGPDGYVIHDTSHPRRPDVSVADRAYFAAHRGDPDLQSAVSGPYLSRSGAGWFVAVTARLGNGDAIDGIVLAAVQPGYFEALYREMALSEGDVIALFHTDGTLIARHPAGDDAIGRRFSELPLFSTWLPQRASGSHRADGQMYPGQCVVSYRKVEELPLVVYVSRSEHAVLAEWRRSAIGAGVAMGALTLLLAGLLVQQLRRRKRRERERAQRAQADKLEALGQLTGGIAHDFANLLQVMATSLQVIALAPADRDRVAQAAGVARRAAERGGEMVARLLAFAKRQPLELKAADLNSLVAEAHPLVAQAAGSRIALVLHLAPGLPLVLTDESQFEMALLNLVVNARDAMQGHGRIVLRTYAAPAGEICLAVEDDGPGMTRKVRLRSIEPFFTTKSEGTGLGLAQVYGFMQQIGGSLELDSAPGKGTCVRLRFVRAARVVTGASSA